MRDKYKIDYDTIIISCGGMKGCSAISFLQTIQPYITWNKIKNYYGSSIGGLILSFLSIGYTIEEVYQIFYYLNFAHYQDIDIKYMLNYGGLDNGTKYNRLLVSIFQYKNISANITLKELYDRNNINLYLTGTNVSQHNCVYFSHHTHPNMTLLMAIRITTCIPFLYVPIEYEGNVYMDGGLLAPIPMPNPHQDNNKTLAILLQQNPHTNSNPRRNVGGNNKNVLEYCIDIFELYFMNELKKCLENYSGELIEINVDDHIMFEFELTRENKRQLFALGIERGEKYIEELILNIYKKKQLQKYFQCWRRLRERERENSL